MPLNPHIPQTPMKARSVSTGSRSGTSEGAIPKRKNQTSNLLWLEGIPDQCVFSTTVYIEDNSDCESEVDSNSSSEDEDDDRGQGETENLKPSDSSLECGSEVDSKSSSEDEDEDKGQEETNPRPSVNRLAVRRYLDQEKKKEEKRLRSPLYFQRTEFKRAFVDLKAPPYVIR